MSFRKWVFTLNNYTEDEVLFISQIDTQTSEFKYIFYGKEIAPTTGTPHLQGYLLLRKKITFKTLKKIFCNRARLEPMGGEPEDSDIYCSKSGDTYEYGTKPRQGERTDIKKVKEAIDNGAGMKDIIDISINYQTLRTAELLLKYKEKKRNWKPYVIWIHGKSGVGKTREAMENFNGEDVYTCMGSGQWFDGYDAHENVLIDDIRPHWTSFSNLLRLLDRYEFRIPVKGGSRQFLARKIIITAPVHPEEMFCGNGEEIIQLIRRIDLIKEIIKT